MSPALLHAHMSPPSVVESQSLYHVLGVLASASEDGTVQLFDPNRNFERRSTCEVQGDARESTHIHAMLWHPQGVNELLVATASGAVKIYDQRCMMRPQ